ncbi:hypothetical protein HAV15_008936 [Penicillium sp. str. |nr:hypothetical protein HAV15_008936 [Penicillium sp. str. \
MDKRYGPDDQDEKVELNTYRSGLHPNNSFEHPEPFSPSPVSPRPLTPIRPGHFPTDEYGQPVWLQPTARMSGHSDWDSRTPYDSRSASPTLYQNNGVQESHQSLAPLVTSPAPPAFEKDWVKSGSIARIHDRDDAETWKGWKRWVFFLVPFLTLANTGIYLFYLGLRIFCIIMAQRIAHVSYAGAWVFVAIEITVAIPLPHAQLLDYDGFEEERPCQAKIDR